MEYSNLFVCLMGICTVFIGLICIIVLVTVMSNIVRKLDRPVQKAEKESAAPAARQINGTVPSGNGAVTAELAAAVSAVIAEEMGTDVNGIRIVSFKKVSA